MHCDLLLSSSFESQENTEKQFACPRDMISLLFSKNIVKSVVLGKALQHINMFYLLFSSYTSQQESVKLSTIIQVETEKLPFIKQ